MLVLFLVDMVFNPIAIMVCNAIEFDKFICNMRWSPYESKAFKFSSLIIYREIYIACISKMGFGFKPKISQMYCLVISSGKLSTYISFISIFRSDLWWCVWMGCDISCSCEEQGRAIGGCCFSCKVNGFVLWEVSLKLFKGKEELDWFRVFACWLLEFADIVLRTVYWVSTVYW